jgi:hypothetical protein
MKNSRSASMSGETLRQQVDGIWLLTKHLLGSLRKRTVYLCGYTVGTRTRSHSVVFSGALIFLKHWNYLTGQLFVGQVEVVQLFMGLISPMDWQFQVAMTGAGERRSFMPQSTALLSKNLVAVISGRVWWKRRVGKRTRVFTASIVGHSEISS